MADHTKIEWADATWSPMTGCTHVSESCEHCYAERIAGRHLAVTRCPECEGTGYIPFVQRKDYRDLFCPDCDGTGNVGFAPTFHPDRLDIPLHWKRPRRIFVCSMSDLFHEAFTDEQRDRVFTAMTDAPQHTYMVLTKRPELMREYMLGCQRGADDIGGTFPWPNVWLGITVESPDYLWRVDELLKTPAAVRFVSLEPMLAAVDLDKPTERERHAAINAGYGPSYAPTMLDSLDWVIVGGETGPGARPMQPEWALDVWRQCKAAGAPFFFKKLGDAPHKKVWDWPNTEGAAMQATRELPAVST